MLNDLTETIEDAFLEELETGANPPHEFSIYLSWEELLLVPKPVIQIAGYTIKIRAESLQDVSEEGLQ